MSRSLAACTWPLAELGEALAALARAAGLPLDGRPEGHPPQDQHAPWLEATAAELGVQATPVGAPYAALPQLLRQAAPALLDLPDDTGVLLLLGRARGDRLVLLGPDLRRHHQPLAAVRSALARAQEAAADRALGPALLATLPPSRQDATRTALREQIVEPDPCPAGWLLRPPVGAGLLQAARGEGLGGLALGVLATHALGFLLFLAAWALIGRAALGGHADTGWLLAWALALLSMVPLAMASTWLQGSLATRAGAWLKCRLLAGALALPPDQTRAEGVGRFLGRIHEAEAVEQAALGGGMVAALALVELLLAGALLPLGAGGWPQLAVLLAWLGLVGLLTMDLARHRARWTETRGQLTLGLVERMVGQRTRLAQQPPQQWHINEDAELGAYLDHSRHLDRARARLLVLAPRGWLLLGMASLAPAFVLGSSRAELATAVGGVLLAWRALGSLVRGADQLAAAAIAWRQVRPLLQAAARPPEAAELGAALSGESAGGPLLQLREVGFAWPGRPRPVLAGASLELQPGDRLLVEGPSGSGKSTLAGLLAGWQLPDQGLVLLDGLDRATLGQLGWRRRVVSAPQFHANHVLTETFAFNLLMGRRWPPSKADMAEAHQLCQELGLGPLLERMPAGMLQLVGETGWRLSHGERSRLFLARALLQDPALVVLDESFAALDPESLATAMRCVRDRARSLVVIAHP